jgi:CHAT domain-containing protein
VHIASHGRFQPDEPSRTGLVLAGADGAPDMLSILDIGGLRAPRLEHVTLSACWSADTFVVPGRWIFSLPETLCRAGARSVLASLWEADDRIAGAFMQRFYTNLRRLSRADALRDAQLACLRNELRPGLETSDAVFWAGFYLFGDSGRLPCD